MEPQYQKLGSRTFWVFVLENCGISAIIFVLWLIIVIIDSIGISHVFSFAAGYPSAIAFLENVFAWAVLGGLVLWVVALLFAIIGASMNYYGYRFALDENALRIRRGIITKNEVSIPYRQITDVDMEQTLIHQLLGVARLAILTAGHRDQESDSADDINEGALPVILKSRAEEIREELLKRSNVEKVVNVGNNSPQSPQNPLTV